MKEQIRLGLMQIVSGLFRLSSPSCAVDGRPLILISPHPDDDILGCGGLIAAKVQRGARVRVVFLTDGSASHLGHPSLEPSALGRQRQLEARKALGQLGVPLEQLVFFHYPDGQLGRLPAADRLKLTQELRSIIREETTPRMLIPLGDEGSCEHTAANELAVEAGKAEAVEMIEYAVWAWWDPRRMVPRLWRRPRAMRLEIQSWRNLKKSALSHHRSQMEATPPWTSPVLPPALAAACGGPRELYFPRSSHPTLPASHVL